MGLDLAPRMTGVSIYTRYGSHQACYTIEEQIARRSKRDPPITEEDRIRRCIRVFRQISELIATYNVRHVGIEGYAYSQAAQAHQIGEVGGVVKTQLLVKHGILPKVVPPTTARKHVFGYGGSIPGGKASIKRIVSEGLGVSVDNDHEADATVVAKWTFDVVAAEEREIIDG